MRSVAARTRTLGLLVAAGCRIDLQAADVDGDGVRNIDDCGPLDAARFPGNPEVCDGKDNDCDRVIDDGLASTWYVDIDGDGHGDPARSTRTCAPAAGLVAIGDDCNDVLADVHPGMIELCDDKDNDCARGIDDARWSTSFSGPVDPAVLALTGDASVADEPGVGGNRYLRLVRGQRGLQGGAWFVPRVPAERWRLRFRLRMSGVGERAGEGMTFSFLRTQGTPAGGGGQALGIYGADADGWSLEFDVADNGAGDSTLGASHLAFQEVRDGFLLLEKASPPGLADGGWHDIEYLQDGIAFTLRMDGLQVWTGTVAIEPGDQLTMGFTAATSAERAMQFAVDDVEIACPDTPDAVDTASP